MGPLIHVLIAEDEPDVRAALVDLIDSDPEMRVVGEAADADQAIKLAADVKPDVALVDVKMPGGGGGKAAREIRTVCPQAHVVALSAYEDRRTVLEMLRAGVTGYIVKGTPAEDILYTIRRSMQGQGSLSVEVTADVMQELAALLERSESMTRELRELDRTKRELIQILSHELFTPITAIQGFALTVAERGEHMSKEEIESLTEGVSRASNRIRRLVGNLAALARLDRDGVEVSTRPVRVGDLIARSVEEFPTMHARVQLPTGEVLDRRLWADLDLAVRALVILLENALAFSPPDSPVDIEILAQVGSITLVVADRGPGIDPETGTRIFSAFEQGDASSTRTHQGLGIGLYLAQRIMAAHSGTVELESPGSAGSRFRLTFPSLDDAARLDRAGTGAVA